MEFPARLEHDPHTLSVEAVQPTLSYVPGTLQAGVQSDGAVEPCRQKYPSPHAVEFAGVSQYRPTAHGIDTDAPA